MRKKLSPYHLRSLPVGGVNSIPPHPEAKRAIRKCRSAPAYGTPRSSATSTPSLTYDCLFAVAVILELAPAISHSAKTKLEQRTFLHVGPNSFPLSRLSAPSNHSQRAAQRLGLRFGHATPGCVPSRSGRELHVFILLLSCSVSPGIGLPHAPCSSHTLMNRSRRNRKG